MKGLGQRIQTLRKERRLTLIEVAKRTGIDQATLSRIENGKMTGTLESHMRIAEALGLHLTELYKGVIDKIEEKKEKEVRRKLETFSHSSGAVAELLTTGVLQKKMMPLILKLKGGGYTETEEFAAGTERFVYSLKGEVEINLTDEKRSLKAGECLYFNAATPHHFRNLLKSESWCLLVITPTSL